MQLVVRETSPGVFEEILPGSSFFDSHGTLHSWQVAELWNNAELATINVYRIDPAPMPTDPDAVVTGYHFKRNGSLIEQVLDLLPPRAATKDELKAYLAELRFNKEVGGMVSATYGYLLTDRDTRAIIAQTIQSLDLGIVQEPIVWKPPTGFVEVNRAALVGIATEVVAYVQMTFDKESEVSAKIDSGELTKKTQVATAFAS